MSSNDPMPAVFPLATASREALFLAETVSPATALRFMVAVCDAGRGEKTDV